MNARTVIVTVAVLASGLLGVLGAQGPSKQERPSPEAVDKAKKLVEARLAELKATRAVVTPVTDAEIAQTFPGWVFVAVRFPLWPVAVRPPAPLKSQNLFAVKDGKPEHLTDSKGLEAFFKSRLGPVKTAARAITVTRAWLRLAQEFIQDGFYTFTIADSGKVSEDKGISVFGQALVKPERGNKGELDANLVFDADGSLRAVHETNKVVPGIRPRCQATLLLHPDPVVRAVAEDSLLVLGRAARDYLEEQRATAGPELRAAIDRVWQRIVAEGR
jgi:hypothetical protein